MLCRAFSRGCAVTSNRSRLQAERKCSKPPCIAGRLSLCGQRGFMDKLQKCAKAFENLLEIQYRIIIGRKGKTVELVIGFSKLDFHHLMGLGKLKDLRIAKQNRGSVFDEIITGIMTLRRSVPLFVLCNGALQQGHLGCIAVIFFFAALLCQFQRLTA